MLTYTWHNQLYTLTILLSSAYLRWQSSSFSAYLHWEQPMGGAYLATGQLRDTATVLRTFPSLSFRLPYDALINVYIYNSPHFAGHHTTQKEKQKQFPPRLKKRLRKCVSLLLAFHSFQRLVMPCLYEAAADAIQQLLGKKRKENLHCYYRPCINESSIAHNS